MVITISKSKLLTKIKSMQSAAALKGEEKYQSELLEYKTKLKSYIGDIQDYLNLTISTGEAPDATTKWVNREKGEFYFGGIHKPSDPATSKEKDEFDRALEFLEMIEDDKIKLDTNRADRGSMDSILIRAAQFEFE